MVYNIKDVKIDYRRCLIFKNEVTMSMEVKISEDFTKVVVGNMTENYMLKEVRDENGATIYEQSIINCLHNKVIRSILHGGTSDFIFICCNEYD